MCTNNHNKNNYKYLNLIDICQISEEITNIYYQLLKLPHIEMNIILEDKITPAIKNANSNTNKLSPQEFQKTLYNWFNQQGMISNMRSYLRMQMIIALKSTTIGESLNSYSNISLENQALNILIADYLFQHRYDYSLSVFSTEVPIKTLVSEFCFFVFNNEKMKSRHKIDERNVICIMESLGINANSDLGQEILANYKQMEDESLLLVILKIVMNYYKPEQSLEDEVFSRRRRCISSEVNTEGKQKTDSVLTSEDMHLLRHEKTSEKLMDNIEEISKVIRKFMLNYNLPPPIVNHLIEKINSIVKSQVNKELNKLSEQFEQEKSILKAEYMNKEVEFKQNLKQVDNFLNAETKRIEKEHKKLIYLTENMVLNEKKLSDKSREMEDKVKRINELEIKLAKEIENCVRKNPSSPVRTKSPPKLCEMKHCDKCCEENQREIDQLRIQKNGFEKIAENQNVIIANLTAKSNIMYKQLQEGMYTIEHLRSQLAAQNKLLENERRKPQLSERTMSSSEVLTVGTDGEGDHNIDDVIKENHLKLDELDKESIEIERRFKYFQSSLRRL